MTLGKLLFLSFGSAIRKVVTYVRFTWMWRVGVSTHSSTAQLHVLGSAAESWMHFLKIIFCILNSIRSISYIILSRNYLPMLKQLKCTRNQSISFWTVFLLLFQWFHNHFRYCDIVLCGNKPFYSIFFCFTSVTLKLCANKQNMLTLFVYCLRSLYFNRIFCFVLFCILSSEFIDFDWLKTTKLRKHWK